MRTTGVAAATLNGRLSSFFGGREGRQSGKKSYRFLNLGAILNFLQTSKQTQTLNTTIFSNICSNFETLSVKSSILEAFMFSA